MRRRILIILAILSAILFAVWRFHYHGADPRLILNPPPLPPPTPAALFEPAEIDVHEKPFAEAVEDLAARYGCPIVIDRARLAELGVDADTPVSLRLRGVTLHSILAHLNRALSDEVVTTIRNGGVTITNEADVDNSTTYAETRAYPRIAGLDPDDSSDFPYDLMGTLSANASADELGSSLLLTAPREVHEQFDWEIRQFEDYPIGRSWEPIAADGPFQPGNNRIRAALDAETDLPPGDITLAEFAEAIRRQHRIPVLLSALEPSDEPIGLPRHGRIEGIPLRWLLRLLLEPRNIHYTVRDEVLELCDAPEQLNRFYPIHDFEGWFSEDMADLSDLFKECISDRTIEYLSMTSFPGWLRVDTSEQTHGEVEAFLGEFRRAMLPHDLPRHRSTALIRLDKALAAEVLLDADEAVAEFTARIARDFAIDVWLDVKDSVAKRIVGAAPQGTLGDSLDRLLERHELAAIRTDAGLVIVDFTRSHRYLPLEVHRSRLGRHVWNSDSAAEAMDWCARAWACPTDFDFHFGPFRRHSGPSGIVAFYQLPRFHEQFAKLLAAMDRGFDEPLLLSSGNSEPPSAGQSFDATDSSFDVAVIPVGELFDALEVENQRRLERWDIQHDEFRLRYNDDVSSANPFRWSPPEVYDFDKRQAERQQLLKIVDHADFPFRGEELALLGDYLFVMSADLSRHAETNDTLARLKAWLEVDPTAERGRRTFFFASPETPLAVQAYDLRALYRDISPTWHDLFAKLIDDALGDAIDNDGYRIVFLNGILAVQAGPNVLAQVEHALDLLTDDPALRLTLQRAWTAAFDADLQAQLYDRLLATDDPIEHRLCAALLDERDPPEHAFGERWLNALRRAIEANDRVTQVALYGKMPAASVAREEAAELLYGQAAVELPNSPSWALLCALSELDLEGARRLVLLWELGTTDTGMLADARRSLETALILSVSEIVKSRVQQSQPIDDLTSAVLQQLEDCDQSVSNWYKGQGNVESAELKLVETWLRERGKLP